jgi:hypothetical protein
MALGGYDRYCVYRTRCISGRYGVWTRKQSVHHRKVALFWWWPLPGGSQAPDRIAEPTPKSCHHHHGDTQNEHIPEDVTEYGVVHRLPTMAGTIWYFWAFLNAELSPRLPSTFVSVPSIVLPYSVFAGDFAVRPSPSQSQLCRELLDII